MTAWTNVLSELRLAIDKSGTASPWFRGHSDARWSLRPTLGRCRSTSKAARVFASNRSRERTIYGRFVNEAGVLLGEDDGWKAAFAMQHHGLPTRLLDWSTAFGVALYFAMKSAKRDAAVWILSPYLLNKALIKREETFELNDFSGTYHQMFIQERPQLGAAALAFEPPRYHPRVFNQKGGFTVHQDIRNSLDKLAPSVLHKLVIPVGAHKDAREFLSLAGISEFSLFPDLDGLARDFRNRYF